MAIKHSPAPWSVEMPFRIGQAPGIVAADSTDVVLFNGGGGDAGVHGRSADQGLANARLIAAAPDMLAALQGIQKHAEQNAADCAADIQEGGSGGGLHEWNAVLAAIAKATGSDA